MPKVRVYYTGPICRTARNRDEWAALPADGVQVVVVEEPPSPPYPDRHQTGFVFCGKTHYTYYTGVDVYDPLEYGIPKYGELIGDTEYLEIWSLAYADD